MILGRYDDTDGNGSNDRLIIEWNVQGSPISPSPVMFQAILQLNTGTSPGSFTFNYADTDSGDSRTDGASATVGIKDSGTQGANRLLVQFNSTTPYVGSGKAIRFTHTPDTTPPTVSVTSPAGGATVSGTITVTANASDNVGVAGVQFLLDGANLGAEDTTAPYSRLLEHHHGDERHPHAHGPRPRRRRQPDHFDRGHGHRQQPGGRRRPGRRLRLQRGEPARPRRTAPAPATPAPSPARPGPPPAGTATPCRSTASTTGSRSPTPPRST